MKTESSSSRTFAADSCRNRVVAALVLTLLSAAGNAQRLDERLPISLDAESSVFDLRSNQSVFEGLRISQGTIAIEADRGLTSGNGRSSRDFADSTWRFDGDVRIDIDSAKIRSDSAELVFRDHALQRAIVTGEPATFDDRGRRDGQPVSASAREFEYDLDRSVVRFSGDARILEGESNEISGANLVYDIEQQRVNFEGDDETGQRVQITITPDEVRERLDEPETDDDAAQPAEPDATDDPADEQTGDRR